MVKSGRLRAFILSIDGREITLFRLLAKDICILSASCLFKNLQFTLYLDVEKDSTIYIVPAIVIETLSENNIDVKEYLLEQVTSRFSSAMWVMEQTIFGSLSQRVANFLFEQFLLEDSKTLSITHESIAKNIGSSREVVSRMLKDFEKQHIIKTSRGKIDIADLDHLKMMAK
jgi:CRP/FNR family transcriptional regulator